MVLFVNEKVWLRQALTLIEKGWCQTVDYADANLKPIDKPGNPETRYWSLYGALIESAHNLNYLSGEISEINIEFRKTLDSIAHKLGFNSFYGIISWNGKKERKKKDVIAVLKKAARKK